MNDVKERWSKYVIECIDSMELDVMDDKEYQKVFERAAEGTKLIIDLQKLENGQKEVKLRGKIDQNKIDSNEKVELAKIESNKEIEQCRSTDKKVEFDRNQVSEYMKFAVIPVAIKLLDEGFKLVFMNKTFRYEKDGIISSTPGKSIGDYFRFRK